MNIKTTLLVLTLLSFTFFMLNNCAGTKSEGDDSISEEEKAQQQNLDDIESLLGISSSEPTKQPPPPKKVEKKDSDQEKLKLLETDELTSQQKTTSLSTYTAMSENDKQQNDKKISKLENQINEKDIIIEDLKAIINRQDAEIQKLTIEKHSGGSGGYQNVVIGDISSGEYQSRYDEARTEFEAHNYKAAIQYFESLLANSASHSLSDNAQYWIGECHYALRQYNSAIIDFEKVSTFTNSNKKDDAQFKLGVCYLRKGNKAKAMEEFGRLQSDYPKSEYIPKINKVISRFSD